MTQYQVTWPNHTTQLLSRLSHLLEKEILVDVTLMCCENTLKVHRSVLAACSTYFEHVLQSELGDHPLIVLKDLSFSVLRSLVEFMYYGETNIPEDNLSSLIEAAKFLEIKGLSEMVVPHNGIKKKAIPLTSDSICIVSGYSSTKLEASASMVSSSPLSSSSAFQILNGVCSQTKSQIRKLDPSAALAKLDSINSVGSSSVWNQGGNCQSPPTTTVSTDQVPPISTSATHAESAQILLSLAGSRQHVQILNMEQQTKDKVHIVNNDKLVTGGSQSSESLLASSATGVTIRSVNQLQISPTKKMSSFTDQRNFLPHGFKNNAAATSHNNTICKYLNEDNNANFKTNNNNNNNNNNNVRNNNNNNNHSSELSIISSDSSATYNDNSNSSCSSLISESSNSTISHRNSPLLASLLTKDIQLQHAAYGGGGNSCLALNQNIGTTLSSSNDKSVFLEKHQDTKILSRLKQTEEDTIMQCPVVIENADGTYVEVCSDGGFSSLYQDGLSLLQFDNSAMETDSTSSAAVSSSISIPTVIPMAPANGGGDIQFAANESFKNLQLSTYNANIATGKRTTTDDVYEVIMENSKHMEETDDPDAVTLFKYDAQGKLQKYVISSEKIEALKTMNEEMRKQKRQNDGGLGTGGNISQIQDGCKKPLFTKVLDCKNSSQSVLQNVILDKLPFKILNDNIRVGKLNNAESTWPSSASKQCSKNLLDRPQLGQISIQYHNENSVDSIENEYDRYNCMTIETESKHEDSLCPSYYNSTLNDEDDEHDPNACDLDMMIEETTVNLGSDNLRDTSNDLVISVNSKEDDSTGDDILAGTTLGEMIQNESMIFDRERSDKDVINHHLLDHEYMIFRKDDDEPKDLDGPGESYAIALYDDDKCVESLQDDKNVLSNDVLMTAGVSMSSNTKNSEKSFATLNGMISSQNNGLENGILCGGESDELCDDPFQQKNIVFDIDAHNSIYELKYSLDSKPSQYTSSNKRKTLDDTLSFNSNDKRLKILDDFDSENSIMEEIVFDEIIQPVI